MASPANCGVWVRWGEGRGEGRGGGRGGGKELVGGKAKHDAPIKPTLTISPPKSATTSIRSRRVLLRKIVKLSAPDILLLCVVLASSSFLCSSLAKELNPLMSMKEVAPQILWQGIRTAGSQGSAKICSTKMDGTKDNSIPTDAFCTARSVFDASSALGSPWDSEKSMEIFLREDREDLLHGLVNS